MEGPRWNNGINSKIALQIHKEHNIKQISNKMNADDNASLESGASSSHCYNDANSDFHGGYTGSSTKDETASNSEKSADGSASIVGGHETRLVRKSKILLGAILILAATGIAVATHKFLKQEDDLVMSKDVSSVVNSCIRVTPLHQVCSSFFLFSFLLLMRKFELQATEILAVSTLNAVHVFDLFKAEALQLTTHAISTGQEWPYVTHPLFEAEGDLLMNQTNAVQFVAFLPLITASQKEEWEAFSTSNRSWLQNSYKYRDVAWEPSSSICPTISTVMGDCVASTNSSAAILAPIWQIAPGPGPNEQLINFDAFNSDFFSRKFDVMVKSQQSVLSEVINGTFADVPESLLSTPIHKDYDNASPIVAVLVAFIPWNDYFTNVLPKSAGGIIVVVTNLFQSFTFQIDGPKVHFLGRGDLHDSEYDHLEITNDFAAYEGTEGNLEYTLHIYPTDLFYEKHTTNRPLVYTLAVVFVFVLTAMSFILYDILVEKRQKKIMDTATKSSAIVNSLFPANVRDRLMAEANDAKNKKGDKAGTFSNSAKGKAGAIGTSLQGHTMPIADLFSHVTVMFADISGFTAWSSTREPSQVFFLLESIYNAFDTIARKMDVFKVETIGDSYVAVAGLPNPRVDHAEVMARFAYKCLVKMNSLAHNLELSLGPGTAELCMRFGLHR